MKTARICSVLAAALVLSGAAMAADTLEDIEKKILTQAEKNKTILARTATDSDIEGPGMRVKSKSEGTYEVARRAETWLLRMESKSSGTTKIGDQPEVKSEDKSLVIADGQFYYTLTENAGRKTAMKMKIDPSKNTVASKDGFEQMRKNYHLKLLPDEKVEGQEVYAIEATPKKPKPDTIETNKYCYSKETGILVKAVMESKSEQAKSKVMFSLSEIKPNADIKPERFVFKAPEGVEVIDMAALEMAATDTAPAEQKTVDETAEPADPQAKKNEPQAAPAEAEKKESKKSKLGLPNIKSPLK